MSLKNIFLVITFTLSSWNAYSFPSKSDTIALRKIIINDESDISIPVDINENRLFLSKKIILTKEKDNIAFVFDKPDTISLQFFLKGFDTRWSAWRNTGFKEYTSLPAGHFSFSTRYRHSSGRIVELPPVLISIRPAWYMSSPALIFYFILIILIIRTIFSQMSLGFAKKQYQLEQIINSRTEDLILEKEKSEALLANVLPKNTATEIINKGKATKIKYNFVTVLFSDIQGFTRIAEEMNPEVLIDELDKFFFHFDSVVEKYGIEKIKTIGDAYMCAGGTRNAGLYEPA